MSSVAFFKDKLEQWFAGNHRPLPWKGEKDPYLVWLSEIILQQTRVEQGLPYFQRFREAYPTVHQLAAAPQDEVMKLWEGLGYYSRARNLHAAARYISRERDGRFPSTYEEIRKLKGVGPYTAAAIASFAFGLPHAVVDGNVYRVLSRFFGIELPIDTSEGKRAFASLAQDLLDKGDPGGHNQALMDFGATQCTPKAPDCKACPMKEACSAFQEGSVGKLPVKARKVAKRTRYFNYLLINHRGQVLVRKRKEKDIWRNLYEFPLLETTAPAVEKDIRNSHLGKQFFSAGPMVLRPGQPLRQLLTHQVIYVSFWETTLPADEPLNSVGFIRADRKNLSSFAFPKVISRYLDEPQLSLF